VTPELVVLVVFGGIALAVLVIVARHVRGDGLQAAVAALGRSIEDVRVSNTTALSDLRGELQHALGATEQQLVTQTGATQRTLADLSRQLGTLGEQSTRIGDLAKDIGSLQDLLRAPKTRGGFGELMLERLLQDALPASAYEIQYTYRDGSRVDAIVRYGPRIVPIDSKFPAESYTQIASARDETDRRARRRSFLQQVKRHVDAVERYVSPQDSTIDVAFMYLPSEAIYHELTIHDAAPDEPDMLAYCSEHHVIPASPNTLLAYLKLVSLGLRGLAMQERTRDLQQGIAQVRREFERFVELHDQLGRHLDNATKKFDETERALARASGAIEGLAQVPLAAGAEQGVLPLVIPNEPE
jgi:DNA recombination protein RmuC